MLKASSVHFVLAGALVACSVVSGAQLAGCSSDDPTASPGVQADASPDGVVAESDGSTSDGGTPGEDASAPLPTVAEVEPNNGTATDAGAVTQLVSFPSHVTGAINPADDIDVMSASLVAGDVWTWTLDAKGSALAPHLGISELGNNVPTMVAKGPGAGLAEQEHFVLETETYFVIVRDARNVGSSSQHVGSPTHTWQLTGRKTPRAPTALVVPSTAQGTLRTKTAVSIYAFTLTQQTGLDIELKATRKAPPSNVDSRMSLFDATKKKYLITNDDISGSISDSKVGGVLPASDYVLVVENVDPDATDLSFELVTTLR